MGCLSLSFNTAHYNARANNLARAMLAWPPAPIKGDTPDQEQLHEPRRKQMRLEKNPTTDLIVELFGPTVEYPTSPDDERNDFCV